MEQIDDVSLHDSAITQREGGGGPDPVNLDPLLLILVTVDREVQLGPRAVTWLGRWPPG